MLYEATPFWAILAPRFMRRLALFLVILILLPISALANDPERTVDINIERRLANFDIGINGGEISPDGTKVLIFGEDGIEKICSLAEEVNFNIENIGARRLHTIIEKVLDDISFNATDRAGETITVNQKYVQDNLGNLVKDTDLSKFIL